MKNTKSSLRKQIRKTLEEYLYMVDEACDPNNNYNISSQIRFETNVATDHLETLLSKEIKKAVEEERKRIYKLVEYEERHAPRSPQDITLNQQGGWYLGRIDGLQALEEKIKPKKK